MTAGVAAFLIVSVLLLAGRLHGFVTSPAASPGGLRPTYTQNLISQSAITGPAEAWVSEVSSPFSSSAQATSLYYTQDGGRSWRLTRSGDLSVRDFVFAGGGHALGIRYSQTPSGSGGPILPTGLPPDAVVRTADAGLHWAINPLPRVGRVISVNFMDVRTGWCLIDAGGGQGLVFTSTDGGASWRQTARADLSSFPTYGQFFGSKVGVVGRLEIAGGNVAYFTEYTPAPLNGLPATIMRTSDGGHTWSRVAIDAPALREGEPPISQVKVVVLSARTALIELSEAQFSSPGAYPHPASGAFVSTTSDAGRTWSKPLRLATIDPEGPASVYSLWAYADSRHWWTAVQGSISSTSDGGKTWTPSVRTLSSGDTFKSVNFKDSRAGWATIAKGGKPYDGTGFLVTSDGGRTWRYLSLPKEVHSIG